MEEESEESTPKLVNSQTSEEDDVMEVSVIVREDDVKEEGEIDVMKVVEAAKKGICERKEKIKRFRAEKETNHKILIPCATKMNNQPPRRNKNDDYRPALLLR